MPIMGPMLVDAPWEMCFGAGSRSYSAGGVTRWTFSQMAFSWLTGRKVHGFGAGGVDCKLAVLLHCQQLFCKLYCVVTTSLDA